MHDRFLYRWASNCREWKITYGTEEVMDRVKDLPLEERARIAMLLREGVQDGYRV